MKTTRSRVAAMFGSWRTAVEACGRSGGALLFLIFSAAQRQGLRMEVSNVYLLVRIVLKNINVCVCCNECGFIK